MKKLLAVLLAFSLLIPALSASAAEAVFRNGITFGDSRETVAAKETGPRISEDDEKYLEYGYFDIAGIEDSTAKYMFTDNDEMNSVTYQFRAKQHNETIISRDFSVISDALTAEYGKPLGYTGGEHHAFFDNGALLTAMQVENNIKKTFSSPFISAGIIRYNEWDIDCGDYSIKIEQVQYYTIQRTLEENCFHLMSYVKHPNKESGQGNPAADLSIFRQIPAESPAAATDAPSHAMPDNGKAAYFTKGKNEAPFEVTTPAGEDYYYIVLTETDKTTKITSFIVYPGTTVSVEVPLGKYRLFYATGKNWYGDEALFGEETRYYETGDVLEFYETEGGIMYQSVELIKQVGGNLDTDPISESKFPK